MEKEALPWRFRCRSGGKPQRQRGVGAYLAESAFPTSWWITPALTRSKQALGSPPPPDRRSASGSGFRPCPQAPSRFGGLSPAEQIRCQVLVVGCGPAGWRAWPGSGQTSAGCALACRRLPDLPGPCFSSAALADRGAIGSSACHFELVASRWNGWQLHGPAAAVGRLAGRAALGGGGSRFRCAVASGWRRNVWAWGAGAAPGGTQALACARIKERMVTRLVRHDGRSLE